MQKSRMDAPAMPPDRKGHAISATKDAGPDTAMQPDADGLLRLHGRLTVARAGSLERGLAAIDTPVRAIDLGGVERLDTVGAWLIHRLRRDGSGIALVNVTPDQMALIEAVAAADQPCRIRPEPIPFWERELGRVGAYMVEFARTTGAGLAFIGEALIAGWRAMTSRRGLRWNSVSLQVERTGVDALGIIGLMSFLIGIVLAQQGAVQLAQFGADVFVINLVGRATFRELGILLTAIMVAGRSASAFAAQIGSMKLAEEVDAMRTMGLDPMELLVLPRVVALVLVMPLLAFYASVLAVTGGGLFAWVSLDIPPATFVQRLREVVPMTDFWIGISKAPVFGAVIAIVGCFQGFQVSGNAESVGLRTTLAVVQAIFLVIVLDAFFAVFYSALGFN